MSVTFQDIQSASKRIEDAVLITPCVESQGLSDLTGCRIFCKLDNLQRTGSFKERGACNALQLLTPDQRIRGVISASAGNHALALAAHGTRLGIPVTVVMPAFAPLIKQQRCRKLGARVVLAGETFSDAKTKATELQQLGGLTYINGYNDHAIIAGQGTIGLEILDQVPDVDAIVVSVGGAGLLAGICVAVKHLRPQVQIIGVESDHAASFSAAVTAGHPVSFQLRPSLADGLAVGKVGDLAFELAKSRIDRLVCTNEESIALAVVRLMEIEKLVVEGAAATTLAPFLNHQLADLQGKKVVLCLGGGNIDLSILARLIESALVADGRMVRFTATISDRPGSLAKLAEVIASTGAGIQDVTHERTFGRLETSVVNVICTVETRDRAHINELFTSLSQKGIAIQKSADQSS